MLAEYFMMVLNYIDIIGTVAFAVSGVLVGIRKQLDLFGIFVLAIITASGGGIIRDIVIDSSIPVFFTQWKYFAAITVAMLATCLLYRFVHKIISVIIIFDAIGLGVFTVTATYKAIECGLPLLGVIFAGVITGVGGGIMRDVLVNEIPLIFVSEIYAIPSIIGSVLFYVLYNEFGLNLVINTYLCVVVVVVIRVVSVKLKLMLPKVTQNKRIY
ncbi:MAG TPA: TRIC cation channel family protein [Ruminiclostridium sp.]